MAETDRIKAPRTVALAVDQPLWQGHLSVMTDYTSRITLSSYAGRGVALVAVRTAYRPDKPSVLVMETVVTWPIGENYGARSWLREALLQIEQQLEEDIWR